MHGLLYLQPYGEITGSANVKIEGNVAHFDAMGKITGGTFTGTVNNTGSISGGDFTEATVENFDGSITGGKFSNIALDHKSGELTITGDVDLSNGGTLAPLTIGVTDGSIKSITVEKDGMFNAGVGGRVGCARPRDQQRHHHRRHVRQRRVGDQQRHHQGR